jgi:uncharacterized protein (UPF0332 family)
MEADLAHTVYSNKYTLLEKNQTNKKHDCVLLGKQFQEQILGLKNWSFWEM